MNCQFCNQLFPKLVKSHIIPRSFYKKLRDDSQPYTIYLETGRERNNEKYCQSGIYDADIVCEVCEKVFNPYDTHGYRVLKKTLETKRIFHDKDGYPCAYFIENSEYTKLKLFALSMLWRAHVSSHMFFSHVNLGKHANALRSYIADGVAPKPNEYGVVFLHYTEQDYSEAIIPPWRHKINGVNVYRFYLPDIVILINVDQRPMPVPYNKMLLQEQSPHYLVFLPGFSSPEKRYINEMKKQLKSNLSNKKT